VYRFSYEVVFRDIDMFGHVNNAVFCSLLETARYKYFKERFGDFRASFVIAHCEVDYLQPVQLGETLEISISISRIGTSSWDFSYVIARISTGETVAKAVTRQVWYDFSIKKKIDIPRDIRSVFDSETSFPRP
jgi:acyl-CoA thioester hydrolase